MRVLATIVVPPHLSVSGAARAGEDLSRALASRCSMTVASMLEGADRQDLDPLATRVDRVPVRTTLPKGLDHGVVPNRYKTLFYRSDIDRTIRRGGFDLVHLHNPMPALEMRRLARTCDDVGIPYVVSTHGFNEIVNGLRIYRFNAVQRAVWRRLVLAPVRQVVAGASSIYMLSPSDRMLLNELGHTGGNVDVVSNGVEIPGMDDAGTDNVVLKRLGIQPRSAQGHFTFLFLANHTPNKGLPVLLEAFGKLGKPYQLIVGGDRRSDIRYSELIPAARNDQQTVITGRLSDQEVAACFRRADAFVFPTLADTFPLVVLEAMSYGLPVIASKVGGIPHQITDHCGILVEPGDIQAFAGALNDLIADPEFAGRLGAAARRRVRAKFTWDQAAEVAFARYRQILEMRGCPSGVVSNRTPFTARTLPSPQSPARL